MLGIRSDSRLKWSLQSELKPMIDDGEYSFTTVAVTYVNANNTCDFYTIVDLFNIQLMNYTYGITFKWASSASGLVEYNSPLGYNTWFANYDLENAVVTFYVNLVALGTFNIERSDLPTFSSYQTVFGENGAGHARLTYNYLLSYQFFYP